MTIIKHPEKVLQFGEGNFLRAFMDWMIHRMNEQGLFKGSVVVVQPLEDGLVNQLNEQGGDYTLFQRGIVDSEVVIEKEVVSSIRRGLNPYHEWSAFLETAGNPDLRFVVSNTTEAGIEYTACPKPNDCPASFPAKLTAWLADRYEKLGGTKESAIVCLPCELINQNGDKLRECILKHAEDWRLDSGFISWIEHDCTFLNTLVDRIVPGYPHAEAAEMITELGYEDKLLCACEIFHLLVIEGPALYKTELPFQEAGLNMVWTDDMQPYRSRKVGILNAAHTSSVLAAFLCGIDTVREMVEDDLFGAFVESLIFRELVPSLDMERSELEAYAYAVLDRFRNPYIQHELLSISLNSVSKWRVRVLPSLKGYIEKFDVIPPLMAFSLAALILFYREGLRENYTPQDDAHIIDTLNDCWKNTSTRNAVDQILGSTELWGEDLRKIPNLTVQVIDYVETVLNDGVKAVVADLMEAERANA